MTRLTNPVPLFLDGRGALLDAGRIWVGEPGSDPRVNPISLFSDEALSTPLTQPLGTLGGAIVDGGNRVFVFVGEDDFALRVEDADGVLVDYVPSTATATPDYQPLDADLTAIADNGTTPYGRDLLKIANQDGLRAALGLPAALPLAGGTVTGNIGRQSAGSHLYHMNPAYASGRVFGPEYTTDPTSQPGDIWFKPSA